MGKVKRGFVANCVQAKGNLTDRHNVTLGHTHPEMTRISQIKKNNKNNNYPLDSSHICCSPSTHHVLSQLKLYP